MHILFDARVRSPMTVTGVHDIWRLMCGDWQDGKPVAAPLSEVLIDSTTGRVVIALITSSHCNIWSRKRSMRSAWWW